MTYIFVNLKRFDVPRSMGGICPQTNPQRWIHRVMEESVKRELGKRENLYLIYLLPESLILSATSTMAKFPKKETKSIAIGSQSVFRENVVPGGNFGAFTSNMPAAAARNLGCTWTMIGHSEERKDKLGIIETYDPDLSRNESSAAKASRAVNLLMNQEVLSALDSRLNVLLCVGETAEERGSGSFAEQKPRIQEVLKTQLDIGLQRIAEKKRQHEIVIGYEPIWAIGPGKIPPGPEYVDFVSAYIKEVVQNDLGFDPAVVYGGGLKEENAALISSIPTIGGGLVALTRFTGKIAFEPKGLQRIVKKYLS